MHGSLRVLAMLTVLMPLCASASNEKLLVELNSIEGADNRCRLNFVIQNKSDSALESMKLDLVAFGTDGSILRRLLPRWARSGPPRSLCGHSRSRPNVGKSVRSWSTT
jgi:hypothetical protein